MYRFECRLSLHVHAETWSLSFESPLSGPGALRVNATCVFFTHGSHSFLFHPRLTVSTSHVGLSTRRLEKPSSRQKGKKDPPKKKYFRNKTSI